MKTRKTVLVLRTCSKDMTSRNGFKWPKKGPVACNDWDGGKMVCGGGLHGLENGEQSGSYLDWSDEAVWLVIKVRVADGYATGKNELKDKCKFRKGTVVYCGKRDGAVAYLVKRGADPSKVVSGQAVASGYRGQAVANGVSGQAVANGVWGLAVSSGVSGQAVANGDSGQAVASGVIGQATANGCSGQATASSVSGQAVANGVIGQAVANGDSGQAVASGCSGQAVANGDSGQAVANGCSGQAVANGVWGQAVANGCSGQATASGHNGVAFTGYDGCVRSRHNGAMAALWFDNEHNRPRIAVAYVGENGIKPDTWYRTENGVFVEIEE
jgi:hypothetical protein